MARKKDDTKKANAKAAAGIVGQDDVSRDDLETTKAQRREAKAATRREPKPEPPPMTLGPVDKITDVLINPAEGKILEITDLDRNQVVLIPQLAVIDDMWEYCIEVATYRSSRDMYERAYERSVPVRQNMIKRFVYVLAQCRRSLGGKTQKALEDLALADLESRAASEEAGFGHEFDE